MPYYTSHAAMPHLSNGANQAASRTCHRCWLIALAAISAVSLLTPSVYAIDLVQAYNAAVTNSDKLRSSYANRQAASYETDTAKSAWLPQASGSLNANAPFGDLPYYQHSKVTVNWGIGISQKIIDQSANVNIDIAKLNELKSDLNIDATHLQIVADVAKSYLAVLNARERISTTNTQINFLESQRATVSAQYDVGLVTRANVEQVRSQLDQARAQQAANQSKLNTALGDFYRVTGQSQAPTLASSSGQLPQLKPQDVNFWITEALRFNQQIQQSELNYATADKQVDAAKAARQPTLSMNTNYGGNVADGIRNDSGTIGLSFNIPIYAGGAYTARSKAAAYNRESARYEKNATTYQIEQQVRSQYLNLEAQHAQVNALTQAIKSARVALESIQAGYDVGTQTIAEVLSASANLRSSQQNYTLARQNYLLSYITFKQSVGVLSVNDLQIINQSLR